jgi:predicted negative regulator of RcsB-dependent stress response
MEQKSPGEQVKEAVWQYTGYALIMAVVFGAGLFAGYQMWGAGEMGQPVLAKRVATLDQDFNRIKNEREDCQKVLEVTRTRNDSLQKEVAALKTARTP